MTTSKGNYFADKILPGIATALAIAALTWTWKTNERVIRLELQIQHMSQTVAETYEIVDKQFPRTPVPR